MHRSLYVFVLLWLVCGGPLSSHAWAQTAIERAVASGDFAKAAQLATTQLEAGAVKPAQWTQLQRTLGIAHAKLGNAEQARRAFVSALALDPNLRLAGSESVEVRSSFMEARGFWSQPGERLGASAALSDDRLALVVSLVDPAALAARVLVRVRGVGQSQFVETALPPAASMLLSLEGFASEAGVEYSLALIDENANRLWQRGTDVVPLSIGKAAQPETVQPIVRTSPQPAPELAAAPVTPRRRPYYVAAALSFVVAGGAFVVAGINHAERERLAARWNQADCDGTGSTRGDVCRREHDQLQHAQRLALGFYGLAGAGLVAGITSLLLLPKRAGEARTDGRALRCRAGSGLVGVACGASF